MRKKAKKHNQQLLMLYLRIFLHCFVLSIAGHTKNAAVLCVPGIWLHTDGRDTPNFDGDGFVTAPDRTGDFINDLSQFLDVAQENNILVTLVFWNGATMPLPQLLDLFWDDSKLDSYINNVLVPTVAALKTKVRYR
jgi:hypothetical protein